MKRIYTNTQRQSNVIITKNYFQAPSLLFKGRQLYFNII